MNKEERTIICISNRFGYGPTITLSHVIKKLVGRIPAHIVFAGSGICKEAFDSTLKNIVSFVEIDERDSNGIKQLLGLYDRKSTYLISCLNRLAILAAKELQIPCVMVDFLTWMWNEIPSGYEQADYYFSNHFGTKNQKPYMIEVPLIMGPAPINSNAKKEYFLINIGGTQNHLVPGVPKQYLTLLSALINNLEIIEGTKVVVAGGAQAIAFMKNLNKRPEFRIESLPFSEYVSIQQRSKKILSLAGTNSTFYSFLLDVPVAFLLPQVLAHWKLTLFLKNKGFISHCQHWDDYMTVPADIQKISEKESILLTETLAARVLSNEQLFRNILHDLQHMLQANIDTNSQKRFINSIGIDGEEIICNHLEKTWFK